MNPNTEEKISGNKSIRMESSARILSHNLFNDVARCFSLIQNDVKGLGYVSEQKQPDIEE